MRTTLSSDEFAVEEYRPDYNKLNVLAYITDFCNYRCWYCYNRPQKPFKHMNLSRFRKFLDKIEHDVERDVEIELIGGEPSIHPLIGDFCESKNPRECISIYTNYSRDFGLYQRLIECDVKFDITYHEPYGCINETVLENIARTPQ